MEEKSSEGALVRTVVVYKSRSNAGLIAGICGIIFAILSIISIGVVFLPFAAFLSLVSLVRSAGGLSAMGFLAALMSTVLTVTGFIVSPSAWVTMALMFNANPPKPPRSLQPGPIDLLSSVPIGRHAPLPNSGPSVPLLPPLATTAAEVVSIGPTFNCATARDTLAQIICADPELRKVDIEMTQPYFALRQALPNEIQRLRNEAIDFQKRTIEACSIPSGATVAPDLVSTTRRECVLSAYREQRSLWLVEIKQRVPQALDEVERSAEAHLALQRTLKVLGFLPPTADVDGVYGPETRSAIRRAQAQFDLNQSGFATNLFAARLERLAR